ncbi:MAG: NUDIX hydrolase [Patescibacteria group bacterium]
MNRAQDHPWIGIDAIIENGRGKFLLVKRSATSKAYPDMWSILSGTAEWGEEIEDTIKREVMEEIGQEAYDIEFTGRYYDKIGRHPTKTMICLPHRCKLKSYDFVLNHENSEIGWFSSEEINNMELAFDHKQMLKDEGII